MRVIAGSLGGRNFHSPSGHRTHPMSDKLRGALFNALGDISGLSVLDAFAGSGALSCEAVSRGASGVLAIDTDRNAQQVIASNIENLGIAKQVKLVKASIGAWLSTTDQQFDIVLADPPYDNLQPELLLRLAKRVKPGGLCVLSLPPDATISLSDEFKLLSHKDYGDASLRFYRRTEA
jgi:16S rRNA (guanine966-N2)-methyltransferase